MFPPSDFISDDKLLKAFFFRNQRRALEDLNEVQKMLYSSIRRRNPPRVPLIWSNLSDVKTHSMTLKYVEKVMHKAYKD